MSRAEKVIKEILSRAGINVGGSNPWDISVLNNSFYARVLRDGSLGLGESYMDSWWECANIDEFIVRLLKTGAADKNFSWPDAWTYLRGLLFNEGRPDKAFEVGQRHYDAGNDLFEHMLDKRLAYSCAYWDNGAKDLDEAQEAKLDLICRKIGLARGMTVLDIGCGWGSFAGFAAEKYGAEVVGLTVSKEQAAYARTRYKNLPIKIELTDWRQASGRFDRIISIGSFEHVGYKNYRRFFELSRKLLKPDGLSLCHTIGGNYSVKATDPWIGRYIFPNGMLPSVTQIGRAIEKIFVMEDWHNLSTNYDKTLMAWYANVEKSWPELGPRYDERFRRMWRYYLLSCAGSFRARNIELWQIVLSPEGVPGGYRSVR